MMPHIKTTDDILSLFGNIKFDSVLAMYEQGLNFIYPKTQIVVDLQGIKDCDSSCLLLCVGWLREANLQKKSLVFINVPSFMQDIIQVYGLDTILPIQRV